MGQSTRTEITVVYEDATVVHVRGRVWYDTSLNVVDSSNSFWLTGNWANESGVAKNINGSGSFLIYENTQVFTKNYGASYGVSLSSSFTGINYWGSSNVMYANASYTVAARPWDPPAAPSGVTVTRNTDNSHTVNWTRNVSGSAPYEAQRVYRSADDAAFVDITGLISSTAVSYTDTTTSANHQYQYKVMGGNSTAAVLSTASAVTQTTPSAPTGAAAAKSGSNIAVSWANTAPYGRPQVWHAANGVWDGAALATLAVGATTYTHVAPSAAVTHTYRIYAVTTTPVLTSSSYTTSTVVQLAAAPSAPTGLGATPNPNPATEPIALFWTHNPVDSSAQTKRQTRHRVQGSPTWIEDGAVTHADQFVTLTPSSAWSATDGQVWEWAVRTYGQHADPSPWSATSVLSLSARPISTIIGPGSTLAISKVTLDWGYFDAEGSAQSAWNAQLLDSLGVVVEALSGAGTTTSVTFSTTLPNTTSWSVRVQTADSVGLWSVWVVQAFSVTYALPSTPGLVATADPEYGRILLEINNPLPTGGEIDAATNEIHRSIDDGPWEVLFADVPLSTVIVDWSAPIVGTVKYRAVAVSALPSSVVGSEVSLSLNPTLWYFISSGPDWSDLVRFWANVKVSTSDSREHADEYYEGREGSDGELLPVVVDGSAVTSKIDISAVMVEDGSSSEDFRRLVRRNAVFLYRDKRGRYYHCSLSGLDVVENQPSFGLDTVNFTLSRVIM